MIHGLLFRDKCAKPDWLGIQNGYFAHAQKIEVASLGADQKGVAPVPGDKNVPLIKFLPLTVAASEVPRDLIRC